MATTFLNKVTTSDFLSWYFSDTSDAHEIGYSVIDALTSSGKYTICVKDLFDACGYIPGHICVDADEEVEYDPSEVELIEE